MAKEIKQLSQRILGLSKRITENANEITKELSKEFITSVIDATPVDVGQLVSSWKVGLNYRPSGTRLFVPGKAGSTAGANRAAVLSVVLPTIERRVTGQTISFVNDTPYLQYVNKGDYQQIIDVAYQRARDKVKARKLLK